MRRRDKKSQGGEREREWRSRWILIIILGRKVPAKAPQMRLAPVWHNGRLSSSFSPSPPPTPLPRHPSHSVPARPQLPSPWKMALSLGSPCAFLAGTPHCYSKRTKPFKNVIPPALARGKKPKPRRVIRERERERERACARVWLRK